MEQNKSRNRSKAFRIFVIKAKMKKIGITGSLASGKTTASKILSSGKGPLFSADRVVKELYSKNYFNKIIRKRFNIGTTKNIKRILKNKILKDRSNIEKLER